MPPIRSIAALSLLAFALAACGSRAKEAGPTAVQGRVESVTVSVLAEGAPRDLQEIMIEQLELRTKDCANGDQPLDLEVYVTTFNKVESMGLLLGGGSQSMRGAIRVYDQNNTLLSDWDFTGSKRADGDLSKMIAGDKDTEKLASFIGEKLCEKVFRS